MLFLCIANIGPVLMLVALGMAGAAALDPEQKYNVPRAVILGLLILGLPLVFAQFFVRAGRLGGVLCGLFLELLLMAGQMVLSVGVFAGEFIFQFKLLAAVLSAIVVAVYGWGMAILLRAFPEARG
jgi:hypothetical protein